MFARVWDDGSLFGFDLWDWSMLIGGNAAVGWLLMRLI
jgi:hypothetical protein